MAFQKTYFIFACEVNYTTEKFIFFQLWYCWKNLPDSTRTGWQWTLDVTIFSGRCNFACGLIYDMAFLPIKYCDVICIAMCKICIVTTMYMINMNCIECIIYLLIYFQVIHSSSSLHAYLRSIGKDLQKMTHFGEVLLQIFKDYQREDRYVPPYPGNMNHLKPCIPECYMLH